MLFTSIYSSRVASAPDHAGKYTLRQKIHRAFGCDAPYTFSYTLVMQCRIVAGNIFFLVDLHISMCIVAKYIGNVLNLQCVSYTLKKGFYQEIYQLLISDL